MRAQAEISRKKLKAKAADGGPFTSFKCLVAHVWKVARRPRALRADKEPVGFTSLCLFQSQQERVLTHVGRFLTIAWLFVMLIINSSYTASLSSFLSAQKRSREDDLLPFFGGFGFAFQKGDSRIDQFSKAILEMAEDGTLQTLQNAWNIGDKKGRCSVNSEPARLGLESFGGLFSIFAGVYGACLLWRLFTKAIKSSTCLNRVRLKMIGALDIAFKSVCNCR
ncbi:hypothetical protein GOP47_0012730 [Adiantum capillus-veneris]|uniref:Ionotropic glutamate receptor C-terminal domain-containing protein n=1 Tax=Adiantum capillus-veneris TaxID=13818 RepID=A0A9D4ZEP1_ADICA|nr:hypothetical protein GOP47_0012730 [Adiantum capillus-veneris]